METVLGLFFVSERQDFTSWHNTKLIGNPSSKSTQFFIKEQNPDLTRKPHWIEQSIIISQQFS